MPTREQLINLETSPPILPDPRGLSDVPWLERMDLPSAHEYLEGLQLVSWLGATVLLVFGVLYLFYGWKVFKLLVVVNAAALGVVAGTYIGGVWGSANAPLWGALAGGLVFGVLSWPLMRVAVGIMGAIAGGFIGYGGWGYFTTVLSREDLSGYAWVGAILGVLILGLMAFRIFQLIVTIFTSVQGAVMAVTGGLALLLKLGPLREGLEPVLVSNPHVLPALIAAPAILGVAYQMFAARRQRSRPRRAEPAPAAAPARE